ncbi:Gfo/Idh/MocA family oxidoreductase [Barrientosiimonas marina]|uniref:Gfo/Idh/MocA family protein n=1 Tax=Lentibacillus kimchii TaxID=1542911 RepID=A0ABW2UWU9_9BACI
MNFGTVGTGWITDAFIEASGYSQELTHSAVYSRTTNKADAFAQKHDVKHVFTDIQEMAASDVLDVVYIASPNALHFEQSVAFLKQQKHVICEKPIFSNIHEWEEAHRIADEQGVFLLEAMRNVHAPNFRTIWEELQQIGPIRSMILPFVQYSSRYDKHLAGDVPNVFSPVFSGGALVDLGVYPLALALGLFGAPVSSAYYPVKLSSDVDGSGVLILEYPGFTGTILCSKIAQSSNTCEIHGEKGTLVFDNPGDMYHPRIIRPDGGETQLSADDHPNNMVYEASIFAQIICEGDKQTYEKLTKLSRDILMITEKARYSNGILFDSEKS